MLAVVEVLTGFMIDIMLGADADCFMSVDNVDMPCGINLFVLN